MHRKAPPTNVIEVTLFGPGYGEAIAVHLGDGYWILVDSCINPDANEPASLHYLNSIGADAKRVLMVVASHWHDDHVRGFAKLAAAFPNASLVISGVFDDDEAMAFLSAFGSKIAYPQAAGLRELYQTVNDHSKIFFAHQRSILLQRKILGRSMQAIAFSPTKAAQTKAILRLASFLPRATSTPINHAAALSPNMEAVVVHIDFGTDAVLLGSDLEEDEALGWTAVANDLVCSNQRKSSVYKIAHHGSATADSPRIWSDLLVSYPVGPLTPFNNGGIHLPTPSDKARIRKATPNAYLSSDATTTAKRPKIPRDLRKRMTDICPNLSPSNSGYGVVSLRKDLGSSKWDVSLFGRAKRL